MRIVAVQTGLSPKSVLGGTITDREFLTRIADRGVDVHLLVEHGEPIVEHPNFTPHTWRRRLRKKLPYIGNMDVALDLRQLLKRLPPVDWIRFNSPYSVGLGAVTSSAGHRIWGSYLHLEDRPFWRMVDRWLPARCDLITCLSPDTRDDLVRACPRADHDRTIIVPMGIDAARFDRARPRRAAVRARLGVGHDEVLVLFAGVLSRRKGVSDLVAAWRRIANISRARLLIIGKPVEEDQARLVAELTAADARVTHLAGVPYEEMPDYFVAGDVFFFPSHLEGYGIVVGEAMASGMPVVTTRAKGIRGVIAEGETALAGDVGDVNAHADHLRRVIQDEMLRRRLGEAGRRRIATRFAWDGIIDRLMLALEQPMRTGSAA
ncbi:MAG TPA: glycosyltransferase family 4 protein [Gemmatimonadaceae bacterium]|jgi:glycosyltransferase involved in cell wall biosynthesis